MKMLLLKEKSNNPPSPSALKINENTHLTNQVRKEETLPRKMVCG
jgi:hypothetical protein